MFTCTNSESRICCLSALELSARRTVRRSHLRLEVQERERERVVRGARTRGALAPKWCADDYRLLFQIVAAVAAADFSLRDHYVQLDLELLLKNALD